jgi:hypothetical protein
MQLSSNHKVRGRFSHRGNSRTVDSVVERNSRARSTIALESNSKTGFPVGSSHLSHLFD